MSNHILLRRLIFAIALAALVSAGLFAAVLFASPALAEVSAQQPGAPNQAGMWLSANSPSGETLSAIHLVSAADGWSVGQYGEILRWNGTNWQSFSSPTSSHLNGVHLSSPTEGWIVGANGLALHWDGARWSSVPTGVAYTLNDVFSLSANSAWAVGNMGYILRWDGSIWSSMLSPDVSGLNEVEFLAENDGWAAGTNGIYHWDGSNWSLSQSVSASIDALDMYSANNGLAGGWMTAWHWDGTTWSEAAQPPYIPIRSISMGAANDAWAVGSLGMLYHWDGSTWQEQGSDPQGSGPYGVFMLSAAEGWAVGYWGSILHYLAPDPKLTISGPAQAAQNQTVVFSAELGLAPFQLTQPVTYTWQRAGLADIIHVGQMTDTAALSWLSAGMQTISLTAATEYGTVSASHNVLVAAAAQKPLQAQVSGAAASSAGALTYQAALLPITTTLPVTYTWTASGLGGGSSGGCVHTSASLSDACTLTWPAGLTGVQAITMTVSNQYGSAASYFNLTLVSGRTVCANCAYPGLQAAIDAAQPGDLIKVAAGVYTDVHTIGGSSQIGYLTKTLTIQGGYGPNFSEPPNPQTNWSVLDAQGRGRGLYLSGVISPTIGGLRLTGGAAVLGGGIYNGAESFLTLQDTQIYSNTAVGGSGGSGSAGANGGQCSQTQGGNAGSGQAGQFGKGGGLYNAGRLEAHRVSFTNNQANGGQGGTGGKGGGGGSALIGDNGLVICAAGNGGHGGLGGSGGEGQGGGLYNAGSALITNSQFSINLAAGGPAGAGGSGGSGGSYSLYSVASGYGGLGGHGGAGGSATGGGIYNEGGLTGIMLTVQANQTAGGLGGSGGPGGNGGATGSQGGAGGDGGLGAGLFSSGSLWLDASLLTGNQAGAGGHGGQGGSSVTRTQNGIVSIFNGGDGGAGGDGGSGGAGAGSQATFFRVVNSVIAHNQAGGGGAGGPGADCCLSVSTGPGGLPGTGSGLYFSGSQPNLLHLTVVQNLGGDGTGIFLTNSSQLNLVNTILAAQTTGVVVQNGSLANLEATLWGSGDWANQTDWSGSGVSQSFDQTGDPAFVNPAGLDYHLTAASAAIDQAIATGVATDLDDQVRPDPASGKADIGADEYWVFSPLQLLQISGPLNGVIGQSLVYTAQISPSSATPPLTYLWSPQPVSGQNTSQAAFSWDSAGQKTIQLTASHYGVSVNAVYTVTIHTPVQASFSANPLSGPAPLLVTFKNSSSGSYTTCTWTFGDGQTSTDCDPSHTYTQTGEYTVSLSVSGPGGQSTLAWLKYIQVIDLRKIFLPFVRR